MIPNPFFRSGVYMLAFFAAIHMVLLLLTALLTHNPMYVNVFYILGLDGVLPVWLSQSIAGHALSLLLGTLVFLFFFLRKK